jgi:hypothetical protein
MAEMNCPHPLPLPGGRCSCGAVTCQYGVSDCKCTVGYGYEEQCHLCRDKEGRIDNGYCVCTPSSIPPRKLA